jgi:uroporphyrinogen III methyltransferase/synthase
MGMKNLSAIVANLLQEGRPATTPVAIIRWGTRAAQQTIVGSLADIVQRAEAAKLEPPTVIVVGDVVRLRPQLNWFERRPLFGKRVLVTRAKEQAAEFTTLLAAYGAEPVEAPTIRIVPPADWTLVDRAMDDLPSYQWIIFTSLNGVACFMGRLFARGLDARRLAGRTVCCIGPRTAQELERFGVKADVIPEQYQAEGVVAAFEGHKIAGARMLVPRAEVARELLPEELRSRGAQVDVVPVYRTVVPEGDIAAWRDLLVQRRIHAAAFTSSSTMRNCIALLGGAETARELLKPVAIACIGPVTAKTAEEYGLTVSIQARENTVPALADAIAEYYGSRQHVMVGTGSQ